MEDLNAFWSSARVVMNIRLSAWNWDKPPAGWEAIRYNAVFKHEVGHVFKLSHHNCNSMSLMHMGFPSNAPPQGRGNEKVASFPMSTDRLMLRLKWGGTGRLKQKLAHLPAHRHSKADRRVTASKK